MDLKGAYFMTALFSVAMVILGSRLPVGESSQLAYNLSKQVGDVLGETGMWIFRLGFWGGVFSSLVGVFQSVPYLFADYLTTLQGKKSENLRREKSYKFFLLFIALVPISSLYFNLEFIQLFYAVFGALFMPFLAVSLLILNNQKSLSLEFKNSKTQNFWHILTLLFFVIVGFLKFS